MSLWPVPGGWRKFVTNLILILEKIRDENPDFNELVEWIKDEFHIGGRWVRNAMQIVLSHLSLIRKDDNKLFLTTDGIAFLEKRDCTILMNLLRKNIWGIEEMIEWLKDTHTSKELKEKFMAHGASWRDISQVRYRLNWLMALGYVEQTGWRQQSTYSLSERGKKLVS